MRKVGDDPGGDAPDAVALPVDLHVGPLVAVEHADLGLVVAPVQYVAQRCLEPVRHLARVGPDGQIGGHHAQHRGQSKSAAGHESGRFSRHAHLGRIYRQFLLRLAQGGSHRVLPRFQLAAGKGHLAGVALHRLRPVGQQHAGFIAFGDGDQHGGIAQGLA